MQRENGTIPISDMAVSLFPLHIQCWEERGDIWDSDSEASAHFFLFGERVGFGIMPVSLEQLRKCRVMALCLLPQSLGIETALNSKQFAGGRVGSLKSEAIAEDRA